MSQPATETSAPALWEIYGDQFPVREHLIYLNHASVTPLCRASADAMKHLADDARDFGSFNRVYMGYFGDKKPARSTTEARLMVDARVEIDVVAYKPR